MTTFFSRVGLSPSDVGLKVSSRKVLAAVLQRFEVPDENFAQVRQPAEKQITIRHSLTECKGRRLGLVSCGVCRPWEHATIALYYPTQLMLWLVQRRLQGWPPWHC